MKKYGILVIAITLLSGCTTATDVANKATQTINEEAVPDNETISDDQFTENVIGFDLQEFKNMKFETHSEIQEFLNQYNFTIINGDIGAFLAVNEMNTDLCIHTNGDDDTGWGIEFVEAKVPNYNINLDEVMRICNPNGEKEMQFDDESGLYYYSTELDGVQVNYNFSHDSLKEENPQALSITISIGTK